MDETTVTLHGAIDEVAPQILPWVEKRLNQVQEKASARVINLQKAEMMLQDLLRSEKPYGVYFDWGGGVGKGHKNAQTSVFLGAFYRFGKRVRVRLGVNRIPIGAGEKEEDVFWSAYLDLTYFDGYAPPADERLLIRALVNPSRVLAMERLDLRRRNIQMLAGRVGQPMAREIAKTVGAEEIRLSNLEIWVQGSETVVIYKGGLAYYFFFDGEVHRLAPMAGVLAEIVLKREAERWGLTEAARLAVVMGGLV